MTPREYQEFKKEFLNEIESFPFKMMILKREGLSELTIESILLTLYRTYAKAYEMYETDKYHKKYN